MGRRTARRRRLQQIAVERVQRREQGDQHIGDAQNGMRQNQSGERVVEADERKREIDGDGRNDDRNHHRQRQDPDENRLALEITQEDAERARRAENCGEYRRRDADDKAVFGGEEPPAAGEEVHIPPPRISRRGKRQQLARRKRQREHDKDRRDQEKQDSNRRRTQQHTHQSAGPLRVSTHSLTLPARNPGTR